MNPRVKKKELWLHPCALISIWTLQIFGVIRSWCFLLAFTNAVISCHHKLEKNPKTKQGKDGNKE